MLKIGNLQLLSPLMLAPLAGISDLSFRLLNRSFGCGFAFTEMLSAKALVAKNKNTADMAVTTAEDAPLGIQLLSDDPDLIRRALDILHCIKPAIVDINAACPVSKVVKRGEGASLMKNPAKLKKLLKAAVESSVAPVTVKIRSGWGRTTINARDIALHAQDAGICGLFIHGRTKEQGYSGTVDYNIIREVKEAINIPVIASGDALSPQLIKKLFDETGCDGVTIARGALGNPWIFRETLEFIESGKLSSRPDANEIADTMLRHLGLCIFSNGEKTGTMIFRKFFAWYICGLSNARPVKERAFRAVSEAEMKSLIKETRFMKRRAHNYEGIRMQPKK
jgi:tRNA-dihydrouridine synthase B